MSAEVLREAAALMRERAEAATPGPWEHLGDHLVWPSDMGPAANDPILAMVGDAHAESAAHIASWHPSVTLAVADLLEAEAAAQEFDTGVGLSESEAASGIGTFALAVARAYLGSES